MALLNGIAVDNGTALILIVLLVAPIAAIAFARSGRAWREIGKSVFEVERSESSETERRIF
jgi:hypothetical protein